MHSKIAGFVAHLLLVAVAQTAPEAPATLPWEALPAPSDANTQLDGAILVHDLRALRAFGEHTREQLRAVPVGAALVDGEQSTAANMSEQLQDVDDWLDIAAPGDAPVPAILSVLSSGDEMGWEGAVKLGSGVAERLAERHAAAIAGEDNVFALNLKDRTFFVRQDAQGWLRVASDLRWLGAPQGSVPPALLGARASFEGSDAALVLTGKGSIVRRFVEQTPHVVVRIASQGLHALGVGWRMGDGITSQARFVLDAQAFDSLKPVVSRRRSTEPFMQSMGDDVQSFAVAALPDSIKHAFPALLRMRMAQTATPIPDSMLGLLKYLDGHVALTAYDAPGDWALALRFVGPDYANGMLDALRAWLHDVGAVTMAGGQQVVSIEPFEGTPRGVLHLRPAPQMQGPLIAAHGSTLLLVQQRSRLQKLLKIAEPTSFGPAGLFAAPITPMMRHALSGDHAVSMYHVLGGNGMWGDYLGWLANRAQVPTTSSAPKQGPFFAPVMARLPQWVGALTYLWMCTCDVALTADVKKSSLVIDITRSEI